MGGGILTWMTGGDINNGGWVGEAGVSVGKNFFGKQITVVKGVLTWAIGGDIETIG